MQDITEELPSKHHCLRPTAMCVPWVVASSYMPGEATFWMCLRLNGMPAHVHGGKVSAWLCWVLHHMRSYEFLSTCSDELADILSWLLRGLVAQAACMAVTWRARTLSWASLGW